MFCYVHVIKKKNDSSSSLYKTRIASLIPSVIINPIPKLFTNHACDTTCTTESGCLSFGMFDFLHFFIFFLICCLCTQIWKLGNPCHQGESNFSCLCVVFSIWPCQKVFCRRPVSELITYSEKPFRETSMHLDNSCVGIIDVFLCFLNGLWKLCSKHRIFCMLSLL